VAERPSDVNRLDVRRRASVESGLVVVHRGEARLRWPDVDATPPSDRHAVDHVERLVVAAWRRDARPDRNAASGAASPLRHGDASAFALKRLLS